jgi:hypothetical protein
VIAAPERYDIDTSDAERWFSADSMRPVHALNGYLLGLLAAESLRPTGDNRLQLALELGEVIARLDAEGHRRAAHCPIALVDAGFRDEGPFAHTSLLAACVHLRSEWALQVSTIINVGTSSVATSREGMRYGHHAYRKASGNRFDECLECRGRMVAPVHPV